MKRKTLNFIDNKYFKYGDNIINIEDLIQFFINDNNLAIDVANRFNLGSVSTLYKILNYYHIKKPTNKRSEIVKRGCYKKYGVEVSSQAEVVKKKVIDNNLSKYGVEYPIKLKEIKDKCKTSCIIKYGVDNPFKNKTIREKQKETCLKKYGVDNIFKSEQIKHKISNYYVEKYNTSHNEYIHQKMKENNSYNKSNDEEYFYDELLKIFSKDNIKRQYRDEKYPFNCDFYIQNLDMYIEINIHWSHGGKLFENTTKDVEKLNIWKQKAQYSSFYKNAINTWTIRDINKYQTALKNNLNYITIYNKEEMQKILSYLIKLNNS